VSARRRLLRVLLLLYPRDFRDAHGRELVDLYAPFERGVTGSAWDLTKNAFRVRMDCLVDRARFGRLPRERERRSAGLRDRLRAEVKGAVRMFRARPAFPLVVLSTLTLGIGANVAVFTVVNWVVLRPLPFPRPNELVRVWWRPDSFNQRIVALFRERAHSFSGLSAFSNWGFTLTGEGEPEQLSGALVSPEHFAVLGVTPIAGRTFAPGDDEPGRSDVCVLSEGLWKRRFGGETSVVGRRIELAGAGRTACTVIGVVPDRSAALDPYGPRQAFLPLERAADLEKDESWFLSVVGRLRPGVTLDAASAEVADLSRLVRTEMYPRTSEEEVAKARVATLREAIVGGDLKAELYLVTAAAGMVLLVACFNLSMLVLARHGERARELAVRCALGAKPTGVLRQLLVESLLLGLSGGVLATGLAFGATAWLATRLPPEFPRVEGLAVQPRVLLFAFLLSVATAVAFGLAPALRASGRIASEQLRAGATAGGRGRRRLDRWLVGAEIAACLVLLTAAGLLVEGFRGLLRVDPGFDADRVLVAGVEAPESRYRDEATKALFRDLVDRIAAAPGVERVGSIHILPFDSGNWDFSVYPQGRAIGAVETPPRANFRVVTPGYFQAMGIPLLEGRGLTAADRSDGEPVGLVNASLARALWPDESAVGEQIHLFRPTGPVFTVVGVVGDVRQHGLAIEPKPEMYRPLEQWAVGQNNLVIRARGNPEGLAASIREIIWSVDPDLPIVRLSPMREIISGSIATSRFVTLLLAVFAALALSLAAVGVYGVASSIAASRRREIGIRVALGAGSRAVVSRILLQGMSPVAVGIVLGLLGSVTVSKLLRSLLPEATATGPALMVVLTSFLSIVALTACYLPARRASRIDPVSVLRVD
jgi:putative ABC transport system permease protein